MPPIDFEQVFAESSPFVWRVLGRLGVARSDIPDVCQEVFLIVHRRSADYDGRAPVRAWIYGICTRKAAEYRKRAHRRYEYPHEAADDSMVPAEQEHELALREARAKLDAVLAGLGNGQREAFVLYELEELPMSEVASVLECPLQTAYSRLHAARKAVSAAFEVPDAGGKQP